MTQGALQGLDKQSVPDAEVLLSHKVAEFMAQHGYQNESEYVSMIASWHEGWDGRGLRQLDRCKANYMLLNYLLDEWMPWHRQTYDFRLMDVNRLMSKIFIRQYYDDRRNAKYFGDNMKKNANIRMFS